MLLANRQPRSLPLLLPSKPCHDTEVAGEERQSCGKRNGGDRVKLGKASHAEVVNSDLVPTPPLSGVITSAWSFGWVARAGVDTRAIENGTPMRVDKDFNVGGLADLFRSGFQSRLGRRTFRRSGTKSFCIRGISSFCCWQVALGVPWVQASHSCIRA